VPRKGSRGIIATGKARTTVDTAIP